MYIPYATNIWQKKLFLKHNLAENFTWISKTLITIYQNKLKYKSLSLIITSTSKFIRKVIKIYFFLLLHFIQIIFEFARRCTTSHWKLWVSQNNGEKNPLYVMLSQTDMLTRGKSLINYKVAGRLGYKILGILMKG